MKKSMSLTIGLGFGAISLITFSVLIILNSHTKDVNNRSDLEYMNDNTDISYPVSNVLDSNTPLSYQQFDLSKLVNYTHSSGKYGFEYPTEWEFLPERGEMGLRPKEYSCTEACFNEIITVLYFEGQGGDLKTFAMMYDGGSSDEWQEVNLSNSSGIFYNYSSSKLNNEIYWFSNGTDAVKVMFRKFNIYSNNTNTDNSHFKNDFDIILNSFHFIK